ncbi:zinc finger protein JACKDAW-like isoform X1 [Hibiscus syriacus]|uniref:Zinc finger protein JACKDAW-like isoform X1 n=1 Tax=Hibiscus syriacus TaxID=106335 RepID=A0A6A2ZU89_HIBSY|nr:zinc finger protein JACKDAW-like isoform X1 [Hibiscus syriacus]
MLKETLVFPISILALLFVVASTTLVSAEAYSHRHASTVGSGTLSWADDDDLKNVKIREGDIYRLHQGSVFYVQSSLEAEGHRLRIYAIFTNSEDDIYEPSVGAYSSITDMVLGFDSRVLQAAFKVPEDVIEELMRASKPPAIIHVHAVQKEKIFGDWQARLLKAFLGSNRGGFVGKHKKKKPYNVLEADPDFENCNGWSVTVDKKDMHLLKHSNVGIFMVNLTKGSMMAPHWNPRASEIAIVLEGQGMVRVLCYSSAKESECRNMRYRVEEGDVFTVPRFHPMAQMSFNNDSFVFMGFSTSTKKNHPQYLAGKKSALKSLDKEILAFSFNVSDSTIDDLLKPQKESPPMISAVGSERSNGPQMVPAKEALGFPNPRLSSNRLSQRRRRLRSTINSCRL